jgi:hypothetical protein
MKLDKATFDVSNHAMERWRERVRDTDCNDLIESARKSRLIPKGEPVPFIADRVSGTTYSIHDGVLFIMRATSILHAEVITVMTAEVRGKSLILSSPYDEFIFGKSHRCDSKWCIYQDGDSVSLCKKHSKGHIGRRLLASDGTNKKTCQMCLDRMRKIIREKEKVTA